MNDTRRVATEQLLSDDNPWPGLAAYDEAARDYFQGRRAEIDELLARVRAEPLTILFGRSGLGKSSLLMAGLFPRLREKGLLPIYLRLLIGPDAPDPADQMRATFEAAMRDARIEHPPMQPDETLWRFLHRAGLEFWTQDNRLVRPVFVLDQFEEVFTLGRRTPAAIERFRIVLADLIENRLPASLAPSLETATTAQLGIDPQVMCYKIVLSLREDFLADLESWQPWLPSIRRNRMRLLPMRADKARDAILNPHTRHLIEPALADKMVSFLSGRALSANTAMPEATSADSATQDNAADKRADKGAAEGAGEGEVDPALLSLFCTGVNERRKRAGSPAFDDAMVQDATEHVITDFYRDCLHDQPERVRKFIEEELITEQGFRNSYPVSDAIARGYFEPGQLDDLVNRRLLRRDHYLGTERVELTHDLLTRAVMAERDRRRALERQNEAARQARRVTRWIIGSVTVSLAIAAGAFWLIRSAQIARDAALSRQFLAIAQRELAYDPERATLFALNALTHGETLEAREVLAEANRYTWPSADLRAGEQLGGEPVALAVSTNAGRLAVLAIDPGGFKLSLWDITGRPPQRLWITSVADRAAKLLAFARDDSELAVGGGSVLQLLDVQDGRPRVTIAVAGEVQAIAYDPSGAIAWSDGSRVYVRKPAQMPGQGETIALEGVRELSFDAGGRLLAVVQTPALTLATYVISRAGTGRWQVRPEKVDCEPVRSMSAGSGNLSVTGMPSACIFQLSRAGGFVANDLDLPSTSEVFNDVVWSRVGDAHLLLHGEDEITVKSPGSEEHWTAHLKVKGIGLEGHLIDKVSLSPSALRLAVLTRPADAREGRVRVYYLDRRPFFADLPQHGFAVAPDGSWIAVESQQPSRGNGSTVDVFALDQSGVQLSRVKELSVSGTVSGMQSSVDSLLVSVRGEGGSEVTQRFEMPKPLRPATAAASEERVVQGVLGNRPADSSALDSTSAVVSPHSQFEIVSPAGQRKVREVVHRASGAQLRLPRLTGRSAWRFSGDDRWLVFWDQSRIELIDLATRRHAVKLNLPGVRNVSFAGGGTVLGVNTGDRIILVPIEPALAQASARSAVGRDFDDAEQCAYMGVRCDSTGVLAAAPGSAGQAAATPTQPAYRAR